MQCIEIEVCYHRRMAGYVELIQWVMWDMSDSFSKDYLPYSPGNKTSYIEPSTHAVPVWLAWDAFTHTAPSLVHPHCSIHNCKDIQWPLVGKQLLRIQRHEHLSLSLFHMPAPTVVLLLCIKGKVRAGADAWDYCSTERAHLLQLQYSRVVNTLLHCTCVCNRPTDQHTHTYRHTCTRTYVRTHL